MPGPGRLAAAGSFPRKEKPASCRARQAERQTQATDQALGVEVLGIPLFRKPVFVPSGDTSFWIHTRHGRRGGPQSIRLQRLPYSLRKHLNFLRALERLCRYGKANRGLEIPLKRLGLGDKFLKIG